MQGYRSLPGLRHNGGMMARHICRFSRVTDDATASFHTLLTRFPHAWHASHA
jgi:hypothetical protein